MISLSVTVSLAAQMTGIFSMAHYCSDGSDRPRESLVASGGKVLLNIPCQQPWGKRGATTTAAMPPVLFVVILFLCGGFFPFGLHACHSRQGARHRTSRSS